MALKYFAVAVLFLAACRNEPEPRNPIGTDTNARQATSASTPSEHRPPPQSDDNPVQTPREIYIDAITGTNPLTVKGRARTFENAVSIRARDAKGTVVAEEHTTSAGEMGRHNPYEAQLWMVRDPGGSVTVEAFEYSAKDGSIQSLTSKTSKYAVDPMAVTLTFPAGDCTKTAVFKRTIPKSVAMARLLTEALLQGPTSEEKAAGAVSPFPGGAEVRSVVLREGEVVVDFNETLRNVGGACRVAAIQTSVTETLLQLPTVKRVVITAGGSKELALQP